MDLQFWIETLDKTIKSESAELKSSIRGLGDGMARLACEVSLLQEELEKQRMNAAHRP